MTPGELASASLAAGVTAASPLIGVVDADGGLVAFFGGVAMWCATMFKNWLDHRERMAKFEADVSDLRKEARRLSLLADALATDNNLNREWMRKVAETKIVPELPQGFGHRSFDQPSTGINPTVRIDDETTPPHPKGE